MPDRSTLKGKRDYVIIALLVGCALRRRELASLKIEDIQLREGRWVIIDLRGKGGRIRTVAVPIWVKQGIEAWTAAAKIDKGRLLLPLSKSGKIVGDELGDWAIWSVVEQSSKQIGIEHFGAHDLRRTCAKLCRKNGGDLGADQIPARPLFDPDNRTLSRVGAGYRNRGKRQPRTIGFQSCAPRRKLKRRRRHLSVPGRRNQNRNRRPNYEVHQRSHDVISSGLNHPPG